MRCWGARGGDRIYGGWLRGEQYGSARCGGAGVASEEACTYRCERDGASVDSQDVQGFGAVWCRSFLLACFEGGRVSSVSVIGALRTDTRLVSVMLANNEVGTVQDIAEIASVLKGCGIPFHTDAVQAVGHIPVDVRELGVTYLTASGHKFYGMKGAGFLYQKPGAELPALIAGGGQEHGLRAGTENTAGIVALGEALTESCECMADEAVRLHGLVSCTVQEIRENLPEIRVHGEGGGHLPGLVNIGVPGVRSESLVHLLDLKGICVSAASACSAGADVPSHVLLAMGYSEKEAMEALRISYGRETTGQDADDVVRAIVGAVGKIRGI